MTALAALDVIAWRMRQALPGEEGAALVLSELMPMLGLAARAAQVAGRAPIVGGERDRPVVARLDSFLERQAWLFRQILGGSSRVRISVETPRRVVFSPASVLERLLRLTCLATLTPATPTPGPVTLDIRVVEAPHGAGVSVLVSWQPGLARETLARLLAVWPGAPTLCHRAEGIEVGFELPAPEAGASQPLAPDREHQAARVLVVEDEGALRRMAVQTLTRAGYRAVGAASERDVREALRDPRPVHVLFLDLHLLHDDLPDRVASAVRERWPDVAILVTSGDPAAFRDLGAFGDLALEKPYHRNELLDAVAVLAAG